MFAVLTACGGGDGAASAQQVCNDLADADCSQYFKCVPDGMRAYASEAECAAMTKATFSCATSTNANTCAMGTYDGDAGEQCVSDVRGLTCAQFAAYTDSNASNDPAIACADSDVCH